MSRILLPPVMVNDLFVPERQALFDLLASLTDDEWNANTICIGWTVKDLALHLLGDDIGIIRLSEKKILPQAVTKQEKSWENVVKMVNDANAQWVETTRRIPNSLLIKFLETTGDITNKYFLYRDLYSIGRSVSWAGPEPAPVWLDVAREYTERWVHQQQIRDAINKPGLKDKKFMSPIIAAFIRSYPRVLQNSNVANGAIIKVNITGDNGLIFYIVKEENGWKLYQDYDGSPTTIFELDVESTWRYLTKSLSNDEILKRVKIEGNKELGKKLLDAVSIIA